MPEELLDAAKHTAAVNWILAQPLESRVKVRLLKGWSRTVGDTVTAREYTLIEASGIDR
jgi:hypothetical protein